MSHRRDFIKIPLAAALATCLAALGGAARAQPAAVTLLNVSYDPTRELYVEFNQAFARHWKARTGHPAIARRLGQAGPGTGTTWCDRPSR